MTTARVSLGHFLQTRRAAIDPRSVGLPVNPRRRSPGLLREEVALLANVSEAWYGRLEQDSKVRPSFEVLESVAAALLLSAVERRYLHSLVLDFPVPEHSTATVLRLVRDVVTGHSNADLPVYALDGGGELLAWNPSTVEWYADFGGARDGLDRNLLWWTFTAPEARERIVDWSDHAREMVAGIRFSIGTGRADAAAELVVARLCVRSTEFAHWWDTHDVAEHEVQNREMRHPRAGLCRMQLLTVRPPVTTSVSVIYHVFR